jgi:hypothetical protein
MSCAHLVFNVTLDEVEKRRRRLSVLFRHDLPEVPPRSHGRFLALLSVFFLIFERHLWLWACVGLAVGIMLMAASSRIER